MDRHGGWRLSPAYDFIFADGPGGEHTASLNGKGKEIVRAGFLAVAEKVDMHYQTVNAIIDGRLDPAACHKGQHHDTINELRKTVVVIMSCPCRSSRD